MRGAGHCIITTFDVSRYDLFNHSVQVDEEFHDGLDEGRSDLVLLLQHPLEGVLSRGQLCLKTWMKVSASMARSNTNVIAVLTLDPVLVVGDLERNVVVRAYLDVVD